MLGRPIAKTPRSLADSLRRDSLGSCCLRRAIPGKVICSSEVKPPRVKRLAVFVSGTGSNFRSIHASCLTRKINGDVVVVVTNKPECQAAEYASQNSIPVYQYPNKHAPTSTSAQALVKRLREEDRVDYILLAGYLKQIPSELIQVYPKAILNIHPALLPSFGGKGFYGGRVHEAVLSSGAKFSGATVHFVNEEYDRGVILDQRVVPVLEDDTPMTLAARVLEQVSQLQSNKA